MIIQGKNGETDLDIIKDMPAAVDPGRQQYAGRDIRKERLLAERINEKMEPEVFLGMELCLTAEPVKAY